MDILKALNWRYATKRMNGEKIPQQKLDIILESIRLSASSAGLQPYRVIVIESEEMKKKISEKACQQPQVLEGSHLLVFAPWKTFGSAHVDEYITRMADIREVPAETFAQFSDVIKGSIAARTPEQNAEWAARQAYIALGFGLVAAAAENVDATPMEGFNAAAMDEVLGLNEQGLQSVTLLALGYRDEEKDFLVNAKKVRQPARDFFLKY